MIPLRAIRKAGKHEVRSIYIDDWMNKDKAEEVQSFEDWCDIIIVQRLLVNEVLTRIVDLRFSRGKPVVIDLDDAYHHMPRSLRSYRFWKEGMVNVPGHGEVKLRYTPLEQLTWGVKLCDALTSPSSVILDDWKDYQENRFLIPNYIETERYIPYRKMYHDPKEITIGWGGSGSHTESFVDSNIIPAIRRVLTERKNVRFLMAGGSNHIMQKIFHPSYSKRLVTVPWSEYANWPATLSRMDIGVAPLSGAYDDRRSWIKPLEYSLMGIPFIASQSRAYEPYADMGRLVRPKTNEWYDALVDYIDNLDREQGRAAANMIWAEEQDVNRNVDKITEVYERIIERATVPAN